MLDFYTNQTIPWRKKTGVRDNGAPLFAPASDIRGRFEYSRRLIIDAKGERVVSEARAYTKAPVAPGDTLTWDGREWIILAVRTEYGLSGVEMHREARL